MTPSTQVIQVVGDRISVAAQLSKGQIHQLPQQGFKSVINLRSYQEDSTTEEDQSWVEPLGLTYVIEQNRSWSI